MILDDLKARGMSVVLRDGKLFIRGGAPSKEEMADLSKNKARYAAVIAGKAGEQAGRKALRQFFEKTVVPRLRAEQPRGDVEPAWIALQGQAGFGKAEDLYRSPGQFMAAARKQGVVFEPSGTGEAVMRDQPHVPYAPDATDFPVTQKNVTPAMRAGLKKYRDVIPDILSRRVPAVSEERGKMIEEIPFSEKFDAGMGATIMGPVQGMDEMLRQMGAPGFLPESVQSTPYDRGTIEQASEKSGAFKGGQYAGELGNPLNLPLMAMGGPLAKAGQVLAEKALPAVAKAGMGALSRAIPRALLPARVGAAAAGGRGLNLLSKAARPGAKLVRSPASGRVLEKGPGVIFRSWDYATKGAGALAKKGTANIPLFGTAGAMFAATAPGVELGDRPGAAVKGALGGALAGYAFPVATGALKAPFKVAGAAHRKLAKAKVSQEMAKFFNEFDIEPTAANLRMGTYLLRIQRHILNRIPIVGTAGTAEKQSIRLQEVLKEFVNEMAGDVPPKFGDFINKIVKNGLNRARRVNDPMWLELRGAVRDRVETATKPLKEQLHPWKTYAGVVDWQGEQRAIVQALDDVASLQQLKGLYDTKAQTVLFEESGGDLLAILASIKEQKLRLVSARHQYQNLEQRLVAQGEARAKDPTVFGGEPGLTPKKVTATEKVKAAIRPEDREAVEAVRETIKAYDKGIEVLGGQAESLGGTSEQRLARISDDAAIYLENLEATSSLYGDLIQEAALARIAPADEVAAINMHKMVGAYEQEIRGLAAVDVTHTQRVLSELAGSSMAEDEASRRALESLSIKLSRPKDYDHMLSLRSRVLDMARTEIAKNPAGKVRSRVLRSIEKAMRADMEKYAAKLDAAAPGQASITDLHRRAANDFQENVAPFHEQKSLRKILREGKNMEPKEVRKYFQQPHSASQLYRHMTGWEKRSAEKALVHDALARSVTEGSRAKYYSPATFKKNLLEYIKTTEHNPTFSGQTRRRVVGLSRVIGSLDESGAANLYFDPPTGRTVIDLLVISGTAGAIAGTGGQAAAAPALALLVSKALTTGAGKRILTTVGSMPKGSAVERKWIMKFWDWAIKNVATRTARAAKKAVSQGVKAGVARQGAAAKTRPSGEGYDPSLIPYQGDY